MCERAFVFMLFVHACLFAYLCAQVQAQMDKGELPGQQRPEEQAKINAKREAKQRQEEEQKAREAAAARKDEEKKLRAEREKQKEVRTADTRHLCSRCTCITIQPGLACV